jgi:hypothetical protein
MLSPCEQRAELLLVGWVAMMTNQQAWRCSVSRAAAEER